MIDAFKVWLGVEGRLYTGSLINTVSPIEGWLLVEFCIE